MTEQSSKYYAPETLSKIRGLELRARHVVEGYLAGLHRSPYRGWSVEFAEHRAYSPGDELRHVDWKLWARTDRLFVKLYEEETNARAQLLLDGSASMAFRSAPMNKYDYGATVAASLAHLLLRQRDAVGLSLLADGADVNLPPTANPAVFGRLCRALESHAPAGRAELAAELQRVADGLAGRSIVILISDMLAAPEDLLSGFHRLRHDGHGVIAAHVLDPAERSFPFDEQVLFQGMEGEQGLRTHAGQVRGAYLEALDEFRHRLQHGCGRLGVDYLDVDTSEPVGEVLFEFLAGRRAGY